MGAENNVSSDVAASLCLPPRTSHVAPLEPAPAVRPTSREQIHQRVVLAGHRVAWMWHGMLSLVYLGLCFVICGIIAVWYLFFSLRLDAVCCGNVSGTLVERYVVPVMSYGQFLVGQPMWGLTLAVVVIAAVVRVLMMKAKSVYTGRQE